MKDAWTKRRVGAGLSVVLAASAAMAKAAHAADQFMKPTAEELSMTSVPGFPGAAAVVLYREEVDQDDLHSVQHYERVKILTEEGKKYANVELRFLSFYDDSEGRGDSRALESIMGRTIHADGTIIPFTGKPYLKTVEKSGGVSLRERVFTLPDVQVGSIIEYRYADRSENYYDAPRWYLQGDLYVKSAHYMWTPTTHLLQNEDGKMINSIAWYPILPATAKVDAREIPDPSAGTRHQYELTVKDIPPLQHEEYMPPVNSYSYRLLFSFTPYRTRPEFWTSEGKSWSKHAESFMNGGGGVQEATAQIIQGATTQDEKLRQIYAAVMKLENTDYSRQRELREDKAAGMGKTANVKDVLQHARGDAWQLTQLFVAMARAAGMKAYLARVADRQDHLFTDAWMNMNQLDSPLAIVTVDGKEKFFDPGERYCGYGHLAWQHTWVKGLRQTESGTDFLSTPGDGYDMNRANRVANLKLDAHGEVSGKIDLTFTGASALRWRQAALTGDEESTRKEMREHLEAMVPKSMEVKVASIEGLKEYEKPLMVRYEVSGTLGTPTGKRVMLPVDLFEANAAATFPHEKRELPVYFHYPLTVQDAIKIVVAPNLTIEAIPEASKSTLPNQGLYNLTVEQGPNYFVSRRSFVFNDVLVKTDDYKNLRGFYSQVETKDQESVVLKAAPAETASVAEPKGEAK